MLPWILKNRPIWSHCLVYNVTMYFASQIVALDWQNRAATHVCSLRSHLSKCKQSKGVGPWRGSVTGLTKHNITIYLVPWHHNWSAKAKVITITKLMLSLSTLSHTYMFEKDWQEYFFGSIWVSINSRKVTNEFVTFAASKLRQNLAEVYSSSWRRHSFNQHYLLDITCS